MLTLRTRLLPFLLLFGLGCTSATTTNTARTSTEQLLIANAVDQSLDKVDFSSFNGFNVYLQDKYVDCVDKNYVIASTRHRLFKAGARLVDTVEDADVVLELRAGAVGTKSAESFIGTPEIALPGMLSIPEVHFVESKKQEGTAKIGIVAYDPKTNVILGDGGISLARAEDSNWFVAGIGPYQGGSVKQEVNEATTGKAATKHGQLPKTVVFKSPATTDAPRYAEAAPEEKPDVSPASHNEFEPVWARRQK